MDENKFLLMGLGVGVAALAILYLVKKKDAAAGAGAAVGGAAVDFADGLAGGVVTGIGGLIGVPRTDMTECEKAIAEGRTWDASFACPAADFLEYVVS